MKKAAFLDTSIQIARLIHAPEIRRDIENRLKEFSFTVTGLVVRQEFKRRLLKDARYLLDLFHKYRSFAKVHRHIVDILTPYQKRKQKISLELLATIFEHESDDDHTDRAVLLLTGLLRDGLDEFDQSVGHVIEKSDCGCARQEVKRRGDRYELGTDKCSKAENCGIVAFLETCRSELEAILSRLDSLDSSKLTNELASAAKFIRLFLSDPSKARQQDPCTAVGDLLIALESIGVPVFYTMNGKESQYICRALKQSLVVRPSHPERFDIVCRVEDDPWPDF